MRRWTYFRNTILAVSMMVALVLSGTVVQANGTFVLGMTSEAVSLDPHKLTGIGDTSRLSLLYDTLVSLDWDLKTIHPLLATSWDVSGDGLTYTFYLRDDVTFHSGKRMTAHDVVYTYERWLDAETASPTRHRIGLVREITAVDDYTVVFTLSQPDNEFLSNLTTNYAGILNRDVVERLGADYGTLGADGTGPFKLDRWDPREQLVLQRHDAYTWGPAMYENRGPAHVERLIIRIIPEGFTRILELERGSVHLLTGTDFPYEHGYRVERVPSVNVQRQLQGEVLFLGFNMNKEIVKDRLVRVALNHATDKQEIIDSAYHGYGIPAYGPVTPIIPGYWEQTDDYGYPYDPDKARELLEQSGWTMGPDGIRVKDGQRLELPVYFTNNDVHRSMASVVANQWHQVGAELQPVLIDSAPFFARVAAGEHTVMYMSMPHNTPDEVLMFYFHSDNRPAPNRFAFVDERVDELLVLARSTLDTDEWYDAYAEIQRRIIESAVWIPYMHREMISGAHQSVEGYTPYVNYSMGHYKLLDVRVNSR